MKSRVVASGVSLVLASCVLLAGVDFRICGYNKPETHVEDACVTCQSVPSRGGAIHKGRNRCSRNVQELKPPRVRDLDGAMRFESPLGEAERRTDRPPASENSTRTTDRMHAGHGMSAMKREHAG